MHRPRATPSLCCCPTGPRSAAVLLPTAPHQWDAATGTHGVSRILPCAPLRGAPSIAHGINLPSRIPSSFQDAVRGGGEAAQGELPRGSGKGVCRARVCRLLPWGMEPTRAWGSAVFAPIQAQPWKRTFLPEAGVGNLSRLGGMEGRGGRSKICPPPEQRSNEETPANHNDAFPQHQSSATPPHSHPQSLQ